MLEVVITLPSVITLHPLVSEIVLPDAVYCCFTRTTLFTIMFTVIIVVFLLKTMCIPEAVYCCVTRTLFTKLFTCLYDQS